MNAVNADYSIATRESLLERLRGIDNQSSWQEFFDIYWRLIYGFAIKAGLTDDEAQDVVQDTVLSVARNLAGFEYNRAKCAFKTWLLNLTRWRIVDQLRKRKARLVLTSYDSPGEAGDLLSEGAASPENDLEALWNAEWEANLLETAAQRVKRLVKAKKYQMFYLHVLKDLPVKEVAARLGVSSGSVYLASHQVGRIFKREIKSLMRTS